MTREYNHADVCRGSSDGCDCDQAVCESCGRQVPKTELDTEFRWCEECQDEFEGLMAPAEVA